MAIAAEFYMARMFLRAVMLSIYTSCMFGGTAAALHTTWELIQLDLYIRGVYQPKCAGRRNFACTYRTNFYFILNKRSEYVHKTLFQR